MESMKILFSIFLSLYFIGCASALKERCEKTNWFEHSRDVALDGRYLEEDVLIKECKGIDRTSAVQLDLGFKSGRERYCTYENYFRKGELGDVINYRMCGELILKSMQERYISGLKRFCTPDVGYTYGESGKVYKKVCFLDAEEKFLPEYFKGRKEFLQRSILQITEDTRGLELLQAQLAPQIHMITSEINQLPSPQQCTTRSVYNESTKKDEAKFICEEASYIRLRRSDLYNQVDKFRDQFRRHADIISMSAQRLIELRNELTKIPPNR